MAKRLLWQLYPTYLLVVVLCTVGVGLTAWKAVSNFCQQDVQRDLTARANLLSQQLQQPILAGDLPAMARIVQLAGQSTEMRVTVISSDGRVLADNEADAGTMESHRERPEIHKAFSGQTSHDIRYSTTRDMVMMYIAVPLRNTQGIYAVVRTALPLEQLQERLKLVWRDIVIAGVLAAVVSAGLGMYVSRRIAMPMRRIADGARRLAAGDFGVRLRPAAVAEVDALTQSLNEMARQLDEKIRTVTGQRNEMEAMLSSMIEGIFAVDMGERIISINEAAARLLGLNRQATPGQSLHEAVRNVELQRFVARSLASKTQGEEEILFRDGAERFIQVRSTILCDSAGAQIGALVVLNDVTRMHRLETMRRDFVANVSHELKTPITSIKGFVETLRDGAISEPDRAAHFLDIIARQADRLGSIIDDLLALSRIEREAQRGQVQRREVEMRGVLLSSAEDCSAKARHRDIRIDVQCDAALKACVNPQLIEQAIVNLLDNAIKYSEPGRGVELAAAGNESQVEISVRDHGCGIPAEHLSRIFERFYRVDKARSRDMGGTGLGLAIVKHIAQAHGGSVTVTSDVGVGSTFTLSLPLNAEAVSATIAR